MIMMMLPLLVMEISVVFLLHPLVVQLVVEAHLQLLLLL
jgi:hypothetical protein